MTTPSYRIVKCEPIKDTDSHSVGFSIQYQGKFKYFEVTVDSLSTSLDTATSAWSMVHPNVTTWLAFVDSGEDLAARKFSPNEDGTIVLLPE